MRVLCLHGMGTSATIFEAQTATFRRQLSEREFSFDFVDAPFTSPSAPGVDLFWPGPYYSFFQTTDPASITKAQEWLLKLVETKGPYDCVMGFSQGCSLISTLLLRLRVEQPDRPCPFKAAVFVCGGMPLASLEHLGYNVDQAAKDFDAESRVALQTQASSSILLAMGGSRWNGSAMGNVAEADISAPRICELDCEIESSRQIPIPTVHIYGKKDPRMGAGLQLARFCVEEKRRIYGHEGGHDIPRTTVTTDKIVDLMHWVSSEIDQ